jgi:hypothetical protein
VASCASNGSLKRSRILSVQSVCGPLFCLTDLTTSSGLHPTGKRGLGSISINSIMPSGLSILLRKSDWAYYKVILSHLQTDVFEKGLVALDPVKNLSCTDELVNVVKHRVLVGEKRIDIADCKLWALLG